MPNILLLEDDISLNKTIESFLTINGFNVFSAYDGESALDLVYENNIDLMLIDVKVPKLNGFDFLKEIRKEDSKTPAIFITSLNSVEDVEIGFNIGCDDYIKKPFALKELLVRINSLLNRVYGSKDNKIEIDDNIVFDIKEQLVYKDNQKIPLKAKEAKLLSLFLKYQNELVDYDLINKTLWSYEQEPSNGALR
ncbi:MAG: response regulator transcription factor, partial [Epsilonproteobacteria bacterium]|nr:response regulator transcription factor [Campylobacterota bacterium]